MQAQGQAAGDPGSDRSPIRVRLLLGRAGAGKTQRVLQEVRRTLLEEPEGEPILFLAPKQATFQLERQLLAEGTLSGYSRLQLVSFDRLAEGILATLPGPVRARLGEEGRLMGLRALLLRQQGELRTFHAAARMSGFVREVSDTLQELAEQGLTPEAVRRLAEEEPAGSRLRERLEEMAGIWAAYVGWLEAQGLQDTTGLFAAATQRLNEVRGAAGVVRGDPGEAGARRLFAAVWLDGFAELTGQEIELLVALAPHCGRLTFAFCLDGPVPDDLPWISTWSAVGRSCRRLQRRLGAVAGVAMEVETLGDGRRAARFERAPVLAHLEQAWARPMPFANGDPQAELASALRVVACGGREEEARVAAREIVQFVRQKGGRFRECAVLMRSLDAYHAVLRRVFRRYEIPCFVDRRALVSHHPLAELTRAAVRMVAWDWRHDDWFGALKTGLVVQEEDRVDEWENRALAEGWTGEDWREGKRAVSGGGATGDAGEQEGGLGMRDRWVGPFVRFGERLGGGGGTPTGAELAAAVRELWRELGVDRTLTAWSQTPSGRGTAGRLGMGTEADAEQVHGTVWQQMHQLLSDVALAFAGEALPLREWLPVLESGLGQLTVGVVPPRLDQVLIGAVDRSRNPELRLVLVLGMNEGVFPSPPGRPALLTEVDRAALEAHGLSLRRSRRVHLAREDYLGYIACTRATERVVITSADRDAEDRALNPSPFLFRLRRLFPSLQVERGGSAAGRGQEGVESEWVHPVECLGMLGRWGVEGRLPAEGLAGWTSRAGRWGGAWWEPWRTPNLEEGLSSPVAAQLYGARELRTSVSRLEEFAACPFRFFLRSGLRAGERERFEVDPREEGSFVHELLARLDERIRRERGQWRAASVEECLAWVDALAERLVIEFRGGLMADATGRFRARGLVRMVRQAVEALVSWAATTYRGDPIASEVAFGGREASLPAWHVDLGGTRKMQIMGKVDRVDTVQVGSGEGGDGERRVVVLDYKTGLTRFEPLLVAHGIQLQLAAYLIALRDLSREHAIGGGKNLVPGGMFYINLRGRRARAGSRVEAEEEAQSPFAAYQHRGRFDEAILAWLDARNADSESGPSGQFCYRHPARRTRSSDALSADDFRALLTGVESTLRDLGRAILDGVATVSPYARGAQEKACQYCEFASVCRFDPWVNEYRWLEAVPEGAPTDGEAKG